MEMKGFVNLKNINIKKVAYLENLFLRHYLHSKENLNAGIFYKKKYEKGKQF